MDSLQIRNFKDFLLHFNQLSEKCFSRCVDNLNTRNLSPTEEHCVELCARKFINVNHRILGVFVEAQAATNQKRMLEMQEQNAKALAAQEQNSQVGVSQEQDSQTIAQPEQIPNSSEVANNNIEIIPKPITNPAELNANT